MKDPSKPFKAPYEPPPSQSPRPTEKPPLKREIVPCPKPTPKEPHGQGGGAEEVTAENHLKAGNRPTQAWSLTLKSPHFVRHLRSLLKQIKAQFPKPNAAIAFWLHLKLSAESSTYSGYAVQTSLLPHRGGAFEEVSPDNTFANGETPPALLSASPLAGGIASVGIFDSNFVSPSEVPRTGIEEHWQFTENVRSDQLMEVAADNGANTGQVNTLDIDALLSSEDVPSKAVNSTAVSTTSSSADIKVSSTVNSREAAQVPSSSLAEPKIVTSSDIQSGTTVANPSSSSSTTATNSDRNGDVTDADVSLVIDAAGGNQVIKIVADQGIVRIKNFTGVGRGAIPEPSILKEVDVLQFYGADFTADNLILTQEGNDLRVSFLGVASTVVILEDFKLEDLDNLKFVPEGWQTPVGNLLFHTDESIVDIFDVFNADEQSGKLFNTHSVTFLNALDNMILGSESDDTIRGLEGNDTLLGKGGEDWIVGGTGDDVLVGGKGNDTYRGGSGYDQFVIDPSSGTDVVQDFTIGEDLLLFSEEINWHDVEIVYGMKERESTEDLPFTALLLTGSESPFVVLDGVVLTSNDLL